MDLRFRKGFARLSFQRMDGSMFDPKQNVTQTANNRTRGKWQAVR